MANGYRRRLTAEEKRRLGSPRCVGAGATDPQQHFALRMVAGSERLSFIRLRPGTQAVAQPKQHIYFLYERSVLSFDCRSAFPLMKVHLSEMWMLKMLDSFFDSEDACPDEDLNLCFSSKAKALKMCLLYNRI